MRVHQDVVVRLMFLSLFLVDITGLDHTFLLVLEQHLRLLRYAAPLLVATTMAPLCGPSWRKELEPK